MKIALNLLLSSGKRLYKVSELWVVDGVCVTQPAGGDVQVFPCDINYLLLQ